MGIADSVIVGTIGPGGGSQGAQGSQGFQGGGAPTNNPTFTGTVTLPDVSTITSTIWTIQGDVQTHGGIELISVLGPTRTRTLTGTYTPGLHSAFSVRHGAGNSVVTLDINQVSAVLPNPLYWFMTDAATATITFVPGAAQTVMGGSSYEMPGQSAWIVWFNDAANDWRIIAGWGGSRTDYFAASTSPTPSSGVAFVPSALQDCELSFAVSTAATFTVTMGPTTGAENIVLSSTALGIGTFFNKRIPAGWSVIITGTIANLENILAVTC